MHTKRGLLIFLSLLLSFLLLFPYLSSALFAQEPKPTAAVLDLDAKVGVSQQVANLLSDSLRSSLFKTGIFDLVSRENIEALLKEQKFQLSGCTSEECIVKVGRLLGARKVFTGAIGRIGATYTITLKLLDVETGRFEKIEEDRCPKCEEDSLLNSIDNLAARITGTETTSSSSTRTAPKPSLKEITAKDNSQMVLIPAGEFLMGSPRVKVILENTPSILSSSPPTT